jgi:hypothetical protein
MTTGKPCIVRVDKIVNKDPNQVIYPAGGFPTSGAVTAIAVDKYHNWLYYYRSGQNIERINIDDRLGSIPAPEVIDLSGEPVLSTMYINGCTGIDADAEGFVYMCIIGDGSYSVVKIDPNRPADSRIVASYLGSYISYPFDVVVKGDYVYVSNKGGIDNYKILMLSKSDLTLAGNAGSLYTTPPILTSQRGIFYGPERFISITNKQMYLIDEITISGGPVPVPYNRIVVFNDLSWNNWDARVSTPAGDGFKFFDPY